MQEESIGCRRNEETTGFLSHGNTWFYLFFKGPAPFGFSCVTTEEADIKKLWVVRLPISERKEQAVTYTAVPS